MDLYHFHRVLIACAAMFALGFSVYSYQAYGDVGRPVNLAMAGIAAALGVALVGYLIYFNRRLRNLRRAANHPA